MADLLRIATTGLLAYQGALNTTGHNVANASVEGYSRQRVELDTLPGQPAPGGIFGNGVDISAVSRMVDQFVTTQLRADASLYQRAETLRSLGEQVDRMLTDPALGISDRIDGFFATLQDSTSDPRSTALRGIVLSSARQLALRFNALYRSLTELGGGINGQLDAAAQQITSIAHNVARLNAQITAAYGTAPTQRPNDLLDQRDRLIQQLAEIVDVQAVDDGNSINLYLGKGQALVTGTQVNEAVTVADRYDPRKLQLALTIGGQPAVVSYAATGGRVGGLLAFRDGQLDPTLNALGRIALTLSADLNAQNRLGVDLDGDLGGLLFGDVNAQQAAVLRARPAADNDAASTGGVRVFIADASLLTTSDYRLEIGSGGAWRLLRLQDNSLAASGAALTDTLVTVDGFTLDLNLSAVPPGNFVAGDSFLVQPTRRGAESMSVAMSRPEDLAFAAPVLTSSVTGNQGTGRLVLGETFDVGTAAFGVPGQLSPPLLIRFSSPTSYDLLDANTSAVLVAGAGFSPGMVNTLLSRNPGDPDYFGFQVQLSGEPAAGDSFRIGYNASGVSDNRNALLMSALQSADTVGSVSYQGAWGDAVSYVGSTTQHARIDAESSLAVLNQSRDRRESLSGVNLDEEAANLIRFEQAYNASAQVISVARSVLQSLFDAFG